MATADVTQSQTPETTTVTGPALKIWVLALSTYGVGDGATTAMIVWGAPLYREANPILSAVIETFGSSGLVGMKLLAIGACLAISISGYRNDDLFTWYLPPVVLTLVGTVTTLLNLSLLW